MPIISRLLAIAALISIPAIACAQIPSDAEYEKRINQALASNVDVFGMEVLRRGEPSYESVKDYLRPLKLADWSYKTYPLILSDLCSTQKARALCEGTEIHLNIANGNTGMDGVLRRARFVARISVGANAEPFGSDESRLEGPKLEDGYLPIYQWRYRQNGVTYRQTVFALEEPDAGLVVRWKLESDAPGEATVELPKALGLRANRGWLLTDDEHCYVRLGIGNESLYDAESAVTRFRIAPGKPAYLAFSDLPTHLRSGLEVGSSSSGNAHRRCVYRWNSFLRMGGSIDVPEELVNHAWKALLCGIVALTNGDALRYSAHNSYERQYANETCTSILALEQFGHSALARRTLDYEFLYVPKPHTNYSAAGWRLRNMCLYYWLSGDRDFLNANRKELTGYAEMIIKGRNSTPEKLMPREAYAGDHPEILVLNATSNALCWRALRDFAAILEATGDTQNARRYAAEAADFRKTILSAIDRSAVKDGDQVFIPMGLLGDEKPFAHITSEDISSYHNIVIPMLLWSGLFPSGSPRPAQIAGYQENRGGIMLGLLRVGRPAGKGTFTNQDGINEVYGLPRNLYLLSSGHTEQFLLGFYSKLAHGFTRDTFNGAEGTSALPVPGEHFRRMGRPPNSFSNAAFLQALRYMLVMERDTDDNGVPDQLWLATGTPRAWLEPGRSIQIDRMPSAFGPVSYRISAAPDGSRIIAHISRERRGDPKKLVLNLRLPSGKRIRSVLPNGKPFTGFDAGTGLISLPPSAAAYELQVALVRGS